MSKKTERDDVVVIKAPKFNRLQFRLIGTAPLVMNRFGGRDQLIEKQQQGSTSRKGQKREAKDFEALYERARYRSEEGWDGIHAGAFRAAMISACRLVGFQMTLAKLSVFVESDGFDRVDGTPLIRIDGTPEMVTHVVRNATGVVDVRARPMYKQWAVDLRVRYDADQFTPTDVTNLLMRVGLQGGIGEGRPDSKKSAGMGWGTFEIEMADANREAAE